LKSIVSLHLLLLLLLLRLAVTLTLEWRGQHVGYCYVDGFRHSTLFKHYTQCAPAILSVRSFVTLVHCVANA